MKKIVLLFLLAPLSLLAQNKGGKFTLECTISNINPSDLKEHAKISYINGGAEIIDSAKIINNKFTIEGSLNENRLASIKFIKNGGEKPVFLTPGNIKVNISGGNIKVTNSLAHTEYQKFRATNKSQFYPIDSLIEQLQSQVSKPEIKAKIDKLNAGDASLFNDADIKILIGLSNQLKEKSANTKPLFPNYLKENPNSLIISYLINNYIQLEKDKEKLKEFYSFIGSGSQELESVKNFNDNYVNVKEKNPLGTAAIAFTQNDESDKPIALSSFKGKYVLIDFWASWCGPCRAENPNVVSAFNKYKDKNFTILGVSLDNSKEKWLDAIKKDELTWIQVSDLKGWGNDVAKLYGISSIPANFLVDPNGVIVAKNLRGENLDKKLEELLK